MQPFFKKLGAWRENWRGEYGPFSKSREERHLSDSGWVCFWVKKFEEKFCQSCEKNASGFVSILRECKLLILNYFCHFLRLLLKIYIKNTSSQKLKQKLCTKERFLKKSITPVKFAILFMNNKTSGVRRCSLGSKLGIFLLSEASK
jgi:hypothetical protein